MLKSLSALVILAMILSGSEARPNYQRNYYYSPYSRQFQSIQLSNKVPKVPMAVEKLLPKTRTIPALTEFREEYCKGRMPEERIPFPDNSNKFIVCHLGETYDIMSCPRHLVFNVHTSHCENSFRKPKGCSSNPCLNEGQCVDTTFGNYKCQCASGFTGLNCETRTTCDTSDCGPNGVCLQLPPGSPVDHFCLCEEGMTYGLTCNDKHVEHNPCLSNDADLHSFPNKHNKALFLQCEGHVPHIKFCAYPLVYSHDVQRCDWDLNSV